MSEEGLAFCYQYGLQNSFDHLLCSKGTALSYLGRTEEGLKYLHRALAVMVARNQTDIALYCASQLEKLFGYDFKEFMQKIL